MAIISITDANDILKEYYDSGEPANAAYRKNPGSAIAKKVHFTGREYVWPVKYGQAPNRSRTAATALGKANKTNFVSFAPKTVDTYDAKDISQKAMNEVQDEGSFVDLLTSTIDDLNESLGNGLGEDLYLTTGSWLGQVGSGQATVNLVLTNPSHAARFWVGQVIRAATTDGLSGSLSAGSVTITAIDRDLGILTSSVAWTTGIASLAANHYLFNDGDFGIGRAGLPAWIPDSTSGLATLFFGAQRSIDATRLAGVRQTVTGGADIVTSVRAIVSRLGREEGDPDTGFLSFDMLADLESQVESKVQIDVKASQVDMGFGAVRVMTGGRRIDFVPDRSCPDDRMWIGKKSTLELFYSQDKPFVVDDADGAILSRNTGSFSYDIRGSSYSNYAVKTPRDWGVLIFN